MEEPLLQVQNLRIQIKKGNGALEAVEDVSFELREGETLGIVGESGCGKSLTCLALTRLAGAQVTAAGGTAEWEGKPLFQLTEREMEGLRGKAFSMIFQDSISGLNPLMKIGRQIEEALDPLFAPRRIVSLQTPQPLPQSKSQRYAQPQPSQLPPQKLSRAERRAMVCTLLRKVRLDEPEALLNQYPHQLSGGQRQRVMIAMAIAGRPKLLIADEPTTALDVTTQLQILALLRKLQEETGMAMILISHDVAVIEAMCDTVLVMYSGLIVESGKTRDVLRAPRHPYTQGLVRANASAALKGKPLHTIPGAVAPLEQRQAVQGCIFRERCDRRRACCAQPPEPVVLADGRMIRCWLAQL